MKVQTIYETMLSFCLKCRKNTENKNPKVATTKNRRIKLLSKCSVSNTKKSKYIKEQKARELLSSLEIRTPLSYIFLLGRFYFVLKV